MASRKSLPSNLRNKLLLEANHACTICGRSPVRIHHIDGDSSRNTEDNLIVLCLNHHDEAERSKSLEGLSANLSTEALREYKNRLKLGYRPAIGSETVSITSSISNVTDSHIIVAAGDVNVNPSPNVDHTSESEGTKLLPPEQTRPTIGIVTALSKEYAAVEELLEGSKELVVPGRGAGRRYLLGQILSSTNGNHHVALSLADAGNNIAASRATLLLEHFPNIEYIIMVGIAGGIPYPEKPDEHVRLGDIVISNQKGIIQYDFNRETLKETTHRYPPRPPDPVLLEAVRLLEAKRQQPWLRYIEQATQKLGWYRPSEETDRLADSHNSEVIIPHPADPKREKGNPRIFLGPIASANILLANPQKRDLLRHMFKVKAVEMEGSGIADATWNHTVGYLVVRGICDYCDANKEDSWQEYAAVVAAAYVRALLESMPSRTNKNRNMELEYGTEEELENYQGFVGKPEVVKMYLLTRKKGDLWTTRHKGKDE